MESETRSRTAPGTAGDAESEHVETDSHVGRPAGATVLPDPAIVPASSIGAALDWVGMRSIALPLRYGDEVHAGVASVNAWVDLVNPRARGIHMSRLYSLLQSQLADRRIDAAVLRSALDAMLESQSGLSSRAQIDIAMDLVLLRSALVSPMSGWQRYPMKVRARQSPGGCILELELTIGYSSTCPSSAALARHATAEAMTAEFGTGAVAASDIAAWLSSPEGSIATAHAQRSEARLRMQVRAGAPWPEAMQIVDRVETALGTPLQTAVKRVDERAFAQRNAQNLMFCEDAARRLHAVFATDETVDDFHVRVAHLESLHAHDAVASASRSGAYRTLAIDE